MYIDDRQFSEREKEVIGLLLQGKSNKQIALALGISASTVEYHLKNVYKKLQVNSRTEAVLQLGKSIGNDISSELGKSTVEINGEPANNGDKPISTRRIPMNKMYLIFGGLLTTILVVVLVLANIPAQNVEITPTVTFSTMTEVPTKIATETATSLPTQISWAVSPKSCAASNGQLPTLSNPEISSVIRPVNNTLGGGLVQSKEFSIELFLYCDSVFQPNASETSFQSDISGLAIYSNWRYEASHESGRFNSFWGIDPDIRLHIGGPSVNQPYVSQGQPWGIQLALNNVYDFSKPTLLRFVYLLQTESGQLSGAVLSFDVQQSSDGLLPSNVLVTALSDTELESFKNTLPPPPTP